MSTKRSILILATVFVLAGAVWAAKPNVVFILIDDLSHYGVTAYGANRISSVQGLFKDVAFSTPRIDSLAKDGLLCDRAYAYPLCEPTRIALMSGMNNIRNYHNCKAQHASDITFGDVFKREGYETCIVGKWKQTRGTREIPGKDYIFEFGWDEFCCFDVVTARRRMLEPDLVVNGKITNYEGIDPGTGRRWFGPDICNRYALDFIDRNTDKPFFLYYPMLLVHAEHTPTPDTKPESDFDNFKVRTGGKEGQGNGDDQRYFPDMLAYMDKMVGKVLDKLDEHGLRENTIVVVMGDNGTKESFSHTLPDGTVFLGGKGSNTENGLHVPLLLRAPGKIPAGSAYDGLVNLTDIYPTLCEAAGIEVPHLGNLDGISFWPQAVGEKTSNHRKTIYTWYNRNNPSTDLENVIEYAFNTDFKRYAPHAGYPEGRFFDLRTDPLEEGGERKVKVAQAWNKWHHSGLDLSKLTPDQKKAYDELGKVLDAHAYVPVQRMEVVKKEFPLQPGQSTALECRVFPNNATRRGVIWESDNPAVATVDKFGTLTAHKAGGAVITVYSWHDAMPLASNQPETYKKNGIKDTLSINVTR